MGVMAMTKTRNDNLQGSLALLVLKSLEQGPMHGWGITLHIERISNEILRVEEGSLYPALHRMEQERLISSEWGVSENNRRARFYRLTAAGRKQLAAEQENWQKITGAVALVLDFQPA
jgi:PadR family transcriptional regulator PadR